MARLRLTLGKTTSALLLLLSLLPALLYASGVGTVKEWLAGLHDSESVDKQVREKAEEAGDLEALFKKEPEPRGPAALPNPAIEVDHFLPSRAINDDWDGSLASTTRQETCAFLAACCCLLVVFFVFVAVLVVSNMLHSI